MNNGGGLLAAAETEPPAVIDPVAFAATTALGIPEDCAATVALVASVVADTGTAVLLATADTIVEFNTTGTTVVEFTGEARGASTWELVVLMAVALTGGIAVGTGTIIAGTGLGLG